MKVLIEFDTGEYRLMMADTDNATRLLNSILDEYGCNRIWLAPDGADIDPETAIPHWDKREAMPSTWSGDVQISQQGTSLVLSVTRPCRYLGLDRGDFVNVTLRRI